MDVLCYKVYVHLLVIGSVMTWLSLNGSIQPGPSPQRL